jgi:stress-induced-phosphoprotein 1
MAEELKNQGNKAFQAKDYDTAIDLFSKAIELEPSNYVLWSNRSAAKAGKRQYGPALEDAEQVGFSTTDHDSVQLTPLPLVH